MLPQLALRPLQALRDLRPLLARRQPILRLRLIRRGPRPRGLLQLHQRLLLQLPLHAQELRLEHLRRDPACRCGLQQHLEARLREHVLPQ